MNQFLKRSFASLAVVTVLICSAFKGDQGLELNVSSDVIRQSQQGELLNEHLSCMANKTALSLNKRSKVSFNLLARNDRSKTIFRLSDRSLRPLKISFRENRRGSHALLFFADYSELFSGQGNYRWITQAGGQALQSPVAIINGRKVRKLTVWFELEVDGKNYSSERQTLTVE